MRFNGRPCEGIELTCILIDVHASFFVIIRPTRAHRTLFDKATGRSKLKLWASYDNYCIFFVFQLFPRSFSTISL